ncbi:vacuolar protein sorting-associated protein VTA1 homolog [Cimex lectularius]|uniref:Vacuolar protein sorting-associated protein VTA1 homolog n=1 Tax=Cimex lectularius TaxID=79782 RepID=A0A8I6RTB6_CIMLE|nr:vacuolar protein sorting-associated protein VTA1 homolog [Cimex lectularius]
MSLQLPPCPPSLKNIQHYLKTASEHETRDPVVTYWCRLYALQTGLKLDKKSNEAKALLVMLMDWLETQKKALSDNEAITNDVAAQAHIENYAFKIFVWADTQDRSGVFNKNVVKAFYTAGMVMDILTIFGELSEEVSSNCKYAKWKAAYIHNCLKNGETPVAGPFNVDEDGQIQMDNSPPQNNFFNTPTVPEPDRNPSPAVTPQENFNFDVPKVPSSLPDDNSQKFTPVTPQQPIMPLPRTESGIPLDPTLITKAQKYCKFAGSALNYDDVSEAINYLQKALRLLQTGQDT